MEGECFPAPFGYWFCNCTEQTFDEYLAWKQTKYVQPSADVFVPQQPAPDDVVVNVELQSHNNNSELHATISHMEDNERKNDGLARDDVFLSLASERVQTTFAWRDILFSVPVKRSYFFNLIERKTGKTKDILSGVSGYCRPGEILFVMGPSGAGKSTMLDALADRIQLPVEGVQWLDGKRKTETNLRMISKYVQQDDCIMGALTVQEVMNTAAALYVKEPAKRQPLIAATLKMVGLMDQQHTKVGYCLSVLCLSDLSTNKVGDVFFRGLSGGQKRRLSIAIELLALPSILFLDEPTSGLDSAAAFSIMASLRRVAKATNTNLIVTIHQPSQLLFELGDNLLLLSGGKQVYFGPIAVVESHFNMLGFDCPKRTSIAEWLLNLVNQDFGSIGVVERCIFGWKGSMAEQALTKILEDMQVPKAVEDAGKLQRAPFIQHYAVGQVHINVLICCFQFLFFLADASDGFAETWHHQLRACTGCYLASLCHVFFFGNSYWHCLAPTRLQCQSDQRHQRHVVLLRGLYDIHVHQCAACVP